MTTPRNDSWAEQRERVPRRRVPRGSFPAAFLTFSLLLLVFAVGFVIGRVVIARAYVKAGPDLERRTSAEGQGRQGATPAPLAPGQVSLPEPEAPPEQGAAPGAEAPSFGPAGETPPAGERGQAEVPQPSPPEAGQPAGPGTGRAPAADTGEHRYALQAGVFVSQQGARDLADELTRAGYPARVEPDRSGAQTAYRVLTGRYRTEDAARKEADRLRGEGFEAFVVER